MRTVRIAIVISGDCCWRFQMRTSTICICDYVEGWECDAPFIIISSESRLCAKICYAFHLSCLDSSYLSVRLEQSSVPSVMGMYSIIVLRARMTDLLPHT